MKIKNKIFLLASSIITFILLAIFLFNKLFFKTYYLNIKKDLLFSVVKSIKDPRLNIDISKLEEENNIEIYLIKEDFLQDLNININKSKLNDILYKDEIIYNLIDLDKSNDKRLMVISNYDISSFIVITSPFSSVEEPVDIITNFYLKFIIFFLITGYFLSIIFANFISKPIIKMKNIAKKVSHMDFSEKFTFNSKDEIGDLGKSLNIMEIKLKENIDILKNDIAREKENEKMRKEFFSNVSHELKTPIAIIQNYSEGLKENIPSSEEEKKLYIDTILEETEYMNNFVNSLLFLSRSERNFIEFHIEKLDIENIIKLELTRIKNIFPDKLITTKIKENIFYGDKEKFSIIIKNLIENACKYSENKKIEIYVENNYFEIKNLTSISEAELNNLWTPFYMANKSREKKLGTGLGLSIVSELLKKQNYSYGSNLNNGYISFWFRGDKK